MNTNHPTLRNRQRGFIITVELLLIVTILVIGSIVGLVAIRDALVKRVESQRSQEVVVQDANGVAMGKAIGFDEHEAPLIPYIDRTAPPALPDPQHRNFRAFLAVRDDRFTSREPVYYSGDNCTGTPCLKTASDEDTDSFGIEKTEETGSVSYLYALQQSPVYAVGASTNHVPGFLYRSMPQACPVDAGAIRSRYLSQRVVSGSPCEPFALGGGGQPETTCLADVGDGCVCPAGFNDQGDILSLYLDPITALLQEKTLELDAALSTTIVVERDKPGQGIGNPKTDEIIVTDIVPLVQVGELCCPAGTQLQDDGNLVNTTVYVILREVIAGLALDETSVSTLVDPILQPLAGTLHCVVSASFQAAEPVPDPNDPLRNTLERFQPPFRVNLPVNESVDGAEWISTTPDGEGSPR